MKEVSASEYLNVLLLAFQNAEKIYSQSVSDVVQAEIRRDAARKQKDEAYARLEEARVKYSSGSQDHQNNDQPDDGVEKRRLSKSSSFQKRRSSNKTNGFGSKAPQSSGSNNTGVSNGGVNVTSNGNATNGISQSGLSKKVDDPSASSDNDVGRRIEDKKPSPVIQSPRAGSKKAPSIFRKSSARGASQYGGQGKRPSNNANALEPLPSPVSVMELSKGRTREWLDSHLNCDQVGLVRKFFQASFGTKTNQETKKLSVSTIVLNDEYNELVKTTSQIQEMYIGKNNHNSTNTNNGTPQPSLRDKAAQAMVAPQKEPIALFFSPSKGSEPRDIFYVGHWRVIDGQMLDPPRIVKGQLRQCVVKFEFVGLNHAIVRAFNEE